MKPKFKYTKRHTKERIDEIIDINKKEGLSAESFVHRAEDVNNPLHDILDWNDKTAGHQWRLQQARVFINEVKVVVEDKELFAYENVRVALDDVLDPVRQYVFHDDILSDEELRKQTAEQAYNALLYWRNKYNHFSEFRPVIREIDKLEAKRSKRKGEA